MRRVRYLIVVVVVRSVTVPSPSTCEWAQQDVSVPPYPTGRGGVTRLRHSRRLTPQDISALQPTHRSAG